MEISCLTNADDLCISWSSPMDGKDNYTLPTPEGGITHPNGPQDFFMICLSDCFGVNEWRGEKNHKKQQPLIPGVTVLVEL